MKITLDQKSATPLWRQIYLQILRQVSDGSLKDNECLPSIRFVARELGIGIITVKTAYEKLEADGIIYTLPGKGCFVRSENVGDKAACLTAVRDRLRSEVEHARSLGVTESELIDIVRKLYSEG